MAADQIASDAFKNDFGKSSETVFQNGYPGANLGKSLNKKNFPNFLRYRRFGEAAVFSSYAAYECAQGMKMEIEPLDS
jgi:hypothetical protein